MCVGGVGWGGDQVSDTVIPGVDGLGGMMGARSDRCCESGIKCVRVALTPLCPHRLTSGL